MFQAIKTEDKFSIPNREQFDEYIKSLRIGNYIIFIDPVEYQRSKAQNRLYWRWLKILAEDLGEHAEYLHRMFASTFLGTIEELNVITGEMMKTPKSTKDLSTEEFDEYLRKINLFAIENCGYELPTLELVSPV